MAFSIAKPFRKPIWTNIPFLVCVVIIFLFNIACIFLPASSKFSQLFELQPFTTKDGTSYYSYKFWIALGILFNSLLTYGAEKMIVNLVTRKVDASKKHKKEIAFHSLMQGYKEKVKDTEGEVIDHEEEAAEYRSSAKLLNKIESAFVEEIEEKGIYE